MPTLKTAIRRELRKLPPEKRNSPLSVLILMVADYIENRPGFRDFATISRLLMDILDRLNDQQDPGRDPIDDKLLAWLMRQSENDGI